MKYGIIFSILSVALTLYALKLGGLHVLLLWPALSFGVVAFAYSNSDHRVFGKRVDGSMSGTSVVLLGPYLFCLSLIWHMVRLFSREPAYNTLTGDVLIGRRLLSHEIPPETKTVVDLTCEFFEVIAFRSVQNYIAAPILDAATLPRHALVELVVRVADAEGPVYIHCAQGHGRTGLIAALLLIARGEAKTPDDALQIIRSSRPRVSLNRIQIAALWDAFPLIQPGLR